MFKTTVTFVAIATIIATEMFGYFTKFQAGTIMVGVLIAIWLDYIDEAI